jgi:hypothetical protein
MTLKERCQAGEAKLEQVSNALLDPRPEILNYCEAELQEVIGMLSESVDSHSRPAVSDRSELLKLRHRTRLLALQVHSAVNLCQGWTQLGLTQGYTDQGRPALPPSEPLASYEV